MNIEMNKIILDLQNKLIKEQEGLIGLYERRITQLEKNIEKIPLWLFTFIIRMMLMYFLPIADLFQKYNYAISDFRSNIVINGIFTELLNTNHVTVFYGDKHMKHIKKILKQQGFKVVKQTKLNMFM